MTHETRIALLVGMVFIVLFGLVLGQRSISFSKSYNSPESSASEEPKASSPSPEMVSAAFGDRDERSVLEDPRDRPSLQAGAREPQRVEPSVPAIVPHPRLQQIIGQTAQPPVREVPIPAQPGQRTYKVCAGDTLIGIARKVYGRGGGASYTLIYNANRDKISNPRSLAVGQVLIIPNIVSQPAGPQQRKPKVKPPVSGQRPKRYTVITLESLDDHFKGGRTYVVRPGDNLTAIAGKVMGSESRSAVRKLLSANRDLIDDPNKLAIGLKLRIPA